MKNNKVLIVYKGNVPEVRVFVNNDDIDVLFAKAEVKDGYTLSKLNISPKIIDDNYDAYRKTTKEYRLAEINYKIEALQKERANLLLLEGDKDAES